MKLSQLKHIIKEEIQKEIKVTPGGDNLSYLKKMLEVDDNGGSFVDSFYPWDSLVDWMTESEYDEDDDSKEAKDMLTLARIYYDWRNKGLIYHTMVNDYENVSIEKLTKPFKTMVTYGDGHEGVFIILAVF